MDPLSITTAVVGTLQVSCSILSFCYSVRTEMYKIPWTLFQIIEEVRELRNLIEKIEIIFERFSGSLQSDQVEASKKLSETIEPVISNCLAELRSLENRIRPEHIDALLSSRRKRLLQSISWHIQTNDAKESIKCLKKCKAALSLALNSHNL